MAFRVNQTSSGFAPEATTFSRREAFFVETGAPSVTLAGSMLIGGNINVGSGDITIANRVNNNGSTLYLYPGPGYEPLLNNPYYAITTQSNNTFVIGRTDTPGALVPETFILLSDPIPASMSNLTIENDIVLNGVVTALGDVITEHVVSGLSGIRYKLGVVLKSTLDPLTTVDYTGATLLVEPYGTGGGRINIRLPVDFYTNDAFSGVILLTFICDSTDTQTIYIVDHNNSTVHTLISSVNEVATVYSLETGLTTVVSPLTSITATRLSEINRVKTPKKKYLS
jgi:hypothetical protein